MARSSLTDTNQERLHHILYYRKLLSTSTVTNQSKKNGKTFSSWYQWQPYNAPITTKPPSKNNQTIHSIFFHMAGPKFFSRSPQTDTIKRQPVCKLHMADVRRKEDHMSDGHKAHYWWRWDGNSGWWREALCRQGMRPCQDSDKPTRWDVYGRETPSHSTPRLVKAFRSD